MSDEIKNNESPQAAEPLQQNGAVEGNIPAEGIRADREPKAEEPKAEEPRVVEPRARTYAQAAEQGSERGRPHHHGNGRRGDSPGGDDRSSMPRVPRFKRKGCRFCQNKNLVLDYKNVEILERFVTDRGKILPRRITGTCSKHQRTLASAIKRARIIALLPFIVK